MQFHRLVPEPGAVDVGELLSGLKLGEHAAESRPYTIVNFVASADGRATFGGRSGRLGDDGDRVVFHALREQVDAVLVGTATLRTERYGRLIPDAETRRRREQRGRPAEPSGCVVTRGGELPSDIPLFDEPAAAIVVFTTGELKLAGCRAQIQVIRLAPGELTLTRALRRLRADHGVRSLLCEGGPTLFGALLQEQLVDELFLTLAPKLTGGGPGPAVSSGPELPEPAPLRLAWALERAGSLYLRYALV